MMRRALSLLLVLLAAPMRAQVPASLSDSAYAQLIARLSETQGYFDTDNLISNEDSYLHPVSTIRRLGVRGGVYVGVGPDQNFSYIAAIRPRMAFIVDIRRDNLLEHLLFKSMFSLARNRLEYLCLMFGRTAPADTAGWGARSITALLAYIDSAKRDTLVERRIAQRVLARMRETGLPLSTEDIATAGRFHTAFIRSGPGLRFNSHGRPPAPYYPDLRRLLTEHDREGKEASYVAREEDFQFLKSLQSRNLLVPVVGDFASAKALPSVATWILDHHDTVTAFYTSNVEQYLIRDGGYAQFVSAVTRFPRTDATIMIRSYFLGGHPRNVSGYHATQVTQLMKSFVANRGYGSYYALASSDLVDR
jgi:hypothetical protein